MSSNIVTVALAGNPNVGKSTVFNALTGLKQHTGNWTGKTVELAKGTAKKGDNIYQFIDVPGTYSLKPHSKEEVVASEYLCYSKADEIIAVCDATSLERNLYLVLQLVETGVKTIVCVNLLDEAKKKGIVLNLSLLSRELGVKVVGTTARNKKGIETLLTSLSEDSYLSAVKIKYDNNIENSIEIIIPELKKLSKLKINLRWLALRLLEGDDTAEKHLKSIYEENELTHLFEKVEKAKNIYNHSQNSTDISEAISSRLFEIASEISEKVTVSKKTDGIISFGDRLFTNKFTAYFTLFFMLCLIFYITVIGANYPSQWLSVFFNFAENKLWDFLTLAEIPLFLKSMLVTGGFRVLGWVVSVMLPPMAIFFPLFTFFEDLGALPRVAYVLDNGFNKSGTCGKQALTTCMGYGCNCVGISGARIIDSKRERLIAIVTNSITPCNGRFPAIIKLISVFFIGTNKNNILTALVLSLVIVLSLALTLLLSNGLSKTLFKGEGSHYILELPSYRKPKLSKILVESVVNRTVVVLFRAVVVAFPAGIVIWLLANLKFGEESVLLLKTLNHCFEPVGRLMGLDGETLCAFFLGIPANEIVLPITLMSYLNSGELLAIENINYIYDILSANGWGMKTAICYIVFSVVHFPCATALITVFKETKSFKILFLSFVLPTVVGFGLCCLINFFQIILF